MAGPPGDTRGAGPRRDTRGIVNAPELFARVRFRRRLPAEPLRPFLEHYWLIDGHLDEPFTQHVVPHPSVNLVFQPTGGELAGVALDLFSHTMRGEVRVCGVQFRPGGFRPFLPEHPVSRWTGRRVPFPEIAAHEIVGPSDEDDRVRALDAALLDRDPRPDPLALEAMDLVQRIRTDRSILRVADFAREQHTTVRSLQRLFNGYVGVSPKWVILRYRIHEALERAQTDADWARIAAELGYSDQAHLVRDFTQTIGVPPSAYARTSAGGGALE
ncbi:AraC family transcriptional regulator [Lentzea sp. NBRC 105346]|uniref:helix-turn-helix domain-containing protein n=1 Tax=Lentzea sp. NBRC 105346 TaxID=3032205 RepID=UPI0024A24A1D|nr:AraC family transcriptional regulator [Lentzea sp. NBRC 105346]GLZ28288.1 AraC family transcriptional regulator [Lentzea sp. NBRC 105346]